MCRFAADIKCVGRFYLHAVGELVLGEAGLDLGVGVARVLGGVQARDRGDEAALAVETAATVEDLAGTIHAHPTMGESSMEAALGLAGRTVHRA